MHYSIFALLLHKILTCIKELTQNKHVFYMKLLIKCLLFFPEMALAGQHLAMEATEEHSVSDGVIKVIKRKLLILRPNHSAVVIGQKVYSQSKK